MKTKLNNYGLKGNDLNAKIISLMGIKPINESISKSEIELTKLGPDGKAYAIVRENHTYFIKRADKSENLVKEDFKYIGGLKNKMNESHSSYSVALKQLKLKFNSLQEAYNTGANINIFENDNLVADEPKVIENETMTVDELCEDDMELSDAQKVVAEMAGQTISENEFSIKNALKKKV